MHLTDLEIIHYADALVKKSEKDLPDVILEHVEDCQLCKMKVLELAALTEEVKKESASVNVIKSRTDKALFYLRAASVAFIIMVPVYFLIRNHSTETVRQHYQLNRKTPEYVNPEMPADKNLSSNISREKNLYKTIPEYEALCGDNYRSGAVNVISPVINQKSTGIINFNLSFNDNQPRILKVVTNRNNVVTEKSFDNKHLLSKLKFKPGLYYWKIETDSELLYIGKFIITGQ